MTSHRITRLGRYEILGRIATGGMATVYLARLGGDGGFSREFALKVIHPHLADEPGFANRFAEEARLASRVRHPNAVSTVDSGSDQGYSYLVLDLIDGVNLRQLLMHRSAGLSSTQAAFIVGEVAKGLHALHTAANERGEPLQIIHRDLSPHNVMIDRNGRPILIDLGLAKATDRAALTQTGVLAGKLPYMSPEQSRFEALDARSDVFSLGTVLFELCTGAMPFGDAHNAETLRRIQACDLGPVRDALVQQELPQWVIEIILVCLQRDPAQRFGSAIELSEAILQEMQRHGLDVQSVRRRLSAQVEDAMPTIGTIDPATSLPIRISAISDGENPAVSQSGPLTRTGPLRAIPRARGGPSALRWLTVGALASGLAMAALSASSYLRPTRAVSAAQDDNGGSLANDQAPRAPANDSTAVQNARPPEGGRTDPGDAAAPSRGAVPEFDPRDPAADGEEDVLIGPLPPHDGMPARRRVKKLDRPPELKPNPYAPGL